MANKLPAFQFYPGDWLKDPNLRRCSHAAKGVWIDILCLMFESEERGVLVTAGRVWSDDEIARAVGGDLIGTLACIEELTLKGVANRRQDGGLYSKRMVRDEHKRMLCIEAGKRGGNPKLQATLKGSSKGEVKGDAKGDPKRNPTPSSSSSSSSSLPPTVPQGDVRGVSEEEKPEPACQPVLKLEAPPPELNHEEFALEIFELYPRRDGKAAALKAIRAAFKSIPPLELRLKVDAYAKAVARWPEADRRYVPWCQKWMNQRRWLDDPRAWERERTAANPRNLGVTDDAQRKGQEIAAAVAAQRRIGR